MLSKSTVKYIQSLQHKKFRDEHDAFIAEGPKLVNELLADKSFPCVSIYATDEWIRELDPIKRNFLEQKIFPVKDFELEKLSAQAHPHHVAGIFKKRAVTHTGLVRNSITLLLEDIQDPGNLGTILRIADWFNVKNIVCSLHTADMYNPKVVQSSMASIARVNVIYCDVLQWLSENKGVKIYAATLGGTTVGKIGKLREGILVIGNESKGVSEAILNLADEQVTIPRSGEAESLNAAVAAGIILYALT